MRTDVTIVRRRSPRNPSLSTIGHDKYHADPGDLLLYKEHYEGGGSGTRLARYVGLVQPKPGARDAEKIKGLLFVLALDETASFAYERWVAMMDVVRIHPAPEATSFLRWFFGPFSAWSNPEILRRKAAEGYMNEYHFEESRLKGIGIGR